MNPSSRVADGLAGWLTFELRCGRDPLFRELLLDITRPCWIMDRS
jgi:hypothetical protein